MAGMSSAVRGLIPKSSGGRMALGVGLGAAQVGLGHHLYKNSKNKGAHTGRIIGGALMADVGLGVGLRAAGAMASRRI